MRYRRFGILLGIALGTVGCGLTERTQPSNFYLLSPIAVQANPVAQAKRPIAVLVGPISLPRHLDRAEMVTLGAGNRLQLAEFDRWAEPLDGNITRVLAENISRLVPTDGVAMYSGPGPFAYDYQIIAAVPQLEMSADGIVYMTARWRLHDRDGTQIGPARRFEHEERAESATPDMMAAAMSRALAGLSADMAAALKQQRM